MSAMAEKARSAAKEKISRMTRADPHQKVDASGWVPPGAMNADSQTGPKPISRRQFKRGGTVEGHRAKMHAGRKPRASGGVTKTDGSLISTDVKEAAGRANEEHVGGMKRGGRAHKEMGGLALPAAFTPVARKEGGKVHADAAEDKKLIHAMGCKCGKCSGGRVERASGGGNWIAGAIKHSGALHKQLHVPQGEKIPAKKLLKAEHSENPTLARRAHLAETLKGMHKKDGGPVGRASGGRADYGDAAKNWSAETHRDIKREYDANRALTKGPSTKVNPVNSAAFTRDRYGIPTPKKNGGSVSYGGTRPQGGRIARAKGGRAKKGMNVNIIIAPSGAGAAPRPPMPLAAAPPPGGPVGMHQGPPPMMPPGAGMPPPGAMPPPMARKSGGRAYPIETGSGGGLARLEKAQAYASGGPAYPIKDGAGGGKGRLEKIRAYG